MVESHGIDNGHLLDSVGINSTVILKETKHALIGSTLFQFLLLYLDENSGYGDASLT